MPYKIVWSNYNGGTYGISEAEREKIIRLNLEQMVEALMEQGWSCIGGAVIVSSNDLITEMYQTMIKK